MTQKKTDKIEFAEAIITTDGDYCLFLPSDEQKENKSIPSLKVSQNGEFTFSYDALSSYLSYGNYEIEGNRLIAVTEDQKYHYQFITTDYGALLFDAKNSSEILLTDSKQNVDNFMIDGSIFVKTDALRLLREADVLTQNISNNLRQDTTITNQEFQKNITDVEAMQKQILTEKNILQNYSI